MNEIAPADRRSEVVSCYLIAVYMGNSLPIIGIGLCSEIVPGVAAHLVFAIVIGALAGAALANRVQMGSPKVKTARLVCQAGGLFG